MARFYFQSEAAVNHAYQTLQEMFDELSCRTDDITECPDACAEISKTPPTPEEFWTLVDQNPDAFNNKELKDWSLRVNQDVQLSQEKKGASWNAFKADINRFAALYERIWFYDGMDDLGLNGDLAFSGRIRQFSFDTAVRPDDFSQTGTASFYKEGFVGEPTHAETIYDPDEFVIAHPTLPDGTLVEITYPGELDWDDEETCPNSKSVVAMVMDRMPEKYKDDDGKFRVADLSPAVFDALTGNPSQGLARPVSLRVLSEKDMHRPDEPVATKEEESNFLVRGLYSLFSKFMG